MRSILTKIAFTAAIALTFSCGGGGGDGGDDTTTDGNLTVKTGTNGATIYTREYTRALTAGQVTAIADWYSSSDIDFSKNLYLIEEYESRQCQSTGILSVEKDYDVDRIGYSINNNVLSLTPYEEATPIVFNGTSNTLEGTWTRSINKAASCREETYEHCIDYDYETGECLEREIETYTNCDSGYNMTKAVFTPTTVALTFEECLMDRVDADAPRGWTVTIKDCSSYEMSKGSDKITVKYKTTANSMEISATYNGKNCTLVDGLTNAQRQQACTRAFNSCVAQQGCNLLEYDLQEYYEDYLDEYRGGEDFEKCLKDKGFPLEDDDNSSKALNKSLNKSLNKALNKSLKSKSLKK